MCVLKTATGAERNVLNNLPEDSKLTLGASTATELRHLPYQRLAHSKQLVEDPEGAKALLPLVENNITGDASSDGGGNGHGEEGDDTNTEGGAQELPGGGLIVLPHFFLPGQGNELF
eukprot:GSA25T00000943001.1